MEINKKALLQSYLVNRKSIETISEEVGIPQTTLNRRFKKFGIKKRTISESKQGVKLSPEHRDKVIKTLSSSRNQKGNKNPYWKGGKTRKVGKKGKYYIMVRNPEHPNAMQNGYVLEHRLVMEEHLGRYLKKNEFIHHKNGIQDDNKIENLEIVQTQRHYGKLECPHCHKEFLVN